MCGLAGILSQRGESREELETVARRMAATLRHRGPDDAGSWSDPRHGVAFGFRRLAILDLSPAGHQPMQSSSGRYTIVFNGEVYNHRSLRARLEGDGTAFRGHSDTEVVLAAFDRWGVRPALRRFVGMFAMAVWDAGEGKLTLVRDRLGIKPLYVHAAGGSVSFASELRGLREAPGFDAALDPDAVAAYLRNLYVPDPHCIFRNVQKLPPGHLLELHAPRPGLPRPEPYWSAGDVAREGARAGFSGNEEDALEELERLLRDAVETRLQADVPVGLLLSGGVDSTAVASFAQECSEQPVKSFTIGFRKRAHDEASHARRVAEHLGTDHTELTVGAEDALAVVPELAEIQDEPHANPSLIPTYLISRLARDSVTVALSGDGGDEVFGGYNRYVYGSRLLPWFHGTPRPVRRLAAAAIESVPAERWSAVHAGLSPLLPPPLRQRLAGEKLAKVGRLLRQEDVSGMYRSLLSCSDPARLMRNGAPEPDDPLVGIFGRREPSDLLHRMMLADQVMYLPGDLLSKVDRASMAVSLEVRVPLLDHRIQEFSWRLPRDFKVRGLTGKRLLRKLLHRRVPRDLVDRPKVGFTVPVDDWLRGALRPWAEEHLSRESLERDGLFDAPAVREEWKRFLGGHSDLAPGLWAVVTFQSWRDRWREAGRDGVGFTNRGSPATGGRGRTRGSSARPSRGCGWRPASGG